MLHYPVLSHLLQNLTVHLHIVVSIGVCLLAGVYLYAVNEYWYQKIMFFKTQMALMKHMDYNQVLVEAPGKLGKE